MLLLSDPPPTGDGFPVKSYVGLFYTYIFFSLEFSNQEFRSLE